MRKRKLSLESIGHFSVCRDMLSGSNIHEIPIDIYQESAKIPANLAFYGGGGAVA